MASIAGANALYAPYRNSVVGRTADYSTRVDCDTDTLYIFFSDDGTVTPDDTHIFTTSYDTSINPAYAARLNLGSATVGPTVGTGVVDFADAVFTGASVLTGSTTQESVIIAKRISSSATDPVLAHYGSATGLPLTPNGADVTVVFSASGAWKF